MLIKPMFDKCMDSTEWIPGFCTQIQGDILSQISGLAGKIAAVTGPGSLPDSDFRATRYWRKHNLKLAFDGGYGVKQFNPRRYVRHVYAINTSRGTRSGGPMKEAYRRSVDELIQEFNGHTEAPVCDYHWSRWFGCFQAGVLVAYIRVQRIGNIAMYARILGHGAHLKSGIMFQLHMETRKVLFSLTPEISLIIYGAWESGGEGLQFWKKRAGFVPCPIEIEGAL